MAAPAISASERTLAHNRKLTHIRLERSTDQVIKPINLEALSKWVGQIPADVVKEMGSIAPMLSTLGYDPAANPPDYGKPDAFVMSKMKELEVNRRTWDEKEQEMLRQRESIRSSLLKNQRDQRKEPDGAGSDGDAAPAVAAAPAARDSGKDSGKDGGKDSLNNPDVPVAGGGEVRGNELNNNGSEDDKRAAS